MNSLVILTRFQPEIDSYFYVESDIILAEQPGVYLLAYARSLSLTKSTRNWKGTIKRHLRKFQMRFLTVTLDIFVKYNYKLAEIIF